MKKIFCIFLIGTLLQCTQNESDNIILPKLSSVKAVQLDKEGFIMFEGKFLNGENQVKGAKIFWQENTVIDLNPHSFHHSKDVDIKDSNSFSVGVFFDSDYLYYVAFYFDSGNLASYSETYQYSLSSNSLTRIYPK